MRSLPGIRKFVLWAAVILFASAAQAGEFPLRDGDIVAMAGDSITAQHLHSNYIEAYCVTRFPKWNLQFRNAGVGGDTVPRVLARLDTDVLCWKPTVVTIELGMNDAGRRAAKRRALHQADGDAHRADQSRGRAPDLPHGEPGQRRNDVRRP